MSGTLPPGYTLDALPPGYTLDAPPDKSSTTTARSLARNIAAGVVEGGTALLNVATDPYGTVIGPTIGRVAGTLYDTGAHLFGYQPMTPEQRADLYGQTPTPPAQQPLATRVVNAVDAAIPGTTAASVQANTPA